jgi:protein tyrosine/serine phosphatase
MTRVLQVALGVLIVLGLIAAPVYFAVRQQAQTRNFRVVRPGLLYRAGQMTKDGLRRIFNDYRIKTVINLRDGLTPRDREEEEFCKSEDVQFVRILPSRWGDIGGSVPAEAGVRTFREIIRDPRNYPILIHCFAGIHRTGAYCAIYRMEREHWDNARAIREMKACGYTNLDEELDILGYMEQYRPSWMPAEKATSPPTEAKEPPKAKKQLASKKSRHRRVKRDHSLDGAIP